MIELRAISKEFRRGAAAPVVALRQISFHVEPGELVAIRGASGSGKSSLLNILGCLDQPTSGQYLLDGRNVASATDRLRSRLRSRAIGFIFQAFHLLPRTTAVENVELPALYSSAAGVHGATLRRKAISLLERVGCGHRLRHYPSELSGGEQQRVAIARALINDPPVLLADEPTGNLDAATGSQIMALLAELHREGRTIVLVTHDESVARLAQRCMFLRDGCLEVAPCVS